MQLMHSDAVFRGGSFQWVTFLDPDPELMQRFDEAAAESESDITWADLEPSHAPQ
jgi:hypothetical protein